MPLGKVMNPTILPQAMGKKSGRLVTLNLSWQLVKVKKKTTLNSNLLKTT